MNKRRLIALAIAVCLIAILASGSLAYFTYTKTVTNQFYTYSTTDFPNGPPTNPDQLFSIAVYETNADGSKNYQGLTYENVLPGSELKKDPTVENTGKYSAWIRLNVTVTNAAAWMKACTDIGLTDLGQIFQGFNSTDWHGANSATPTYDAAKDTLTYVFYSNKPLAAGEKSTLFTGMVIPGELTVEHMIALSQFQIIITGDAIQSENTEPETGEPSAAYAFTTYWGK